MQKTLLVAASLLALTTLADAHALSGIATFYPGRRGAGAMTAAHKTLPFGTAVRVTNLANGHAAIVRINDRGPFARGRIIDVSTGAANVLGMRQSGVAPVRLEIVSR